MEGHARRGSYVVGFVLAVALTAIPFAVVAKHYMTPANTLLVIAITAVLQILVHLRFFLHLRITASLRENILAISFTAVLLCIMLGGAFWIMFDLARRMAI
jgi:cytochrome o ubiquinol oxidase operon protein cyoD